jgi:peptidyl-prolyl cis-trans isomerase-like 2
MVKRQKEKLYQSSREHKANAAARANNTPGTGTTSNNNATTTTAAAATSARQQQQQQRLLPFSHCALTLTAYETPVCNTHGIMFENSAILPFILKHGIDPCTGETMTTRDLIALNMHQQRSDHNHHGSNNDEPQWACPILNKPFVQHSKIVAIILDNKKNKNEPGNKHANVYSWQAYQELNVQTNHYEDLLTGQAFDKKRDVLVLYDPNDDDLNRRRDINTFFHISHARKLENEKNKEPQTTTIQHGMTATRIMQQLAKNKQEQKQQQQQQQKDDESKKRAASEANQEQNSANNTTKRVKKNTIVQCRRLDFGP